jgi:hypothetical protein
MKGWAASQKEMEYHLMCHAAADTGSGDPLMLDSTSDLLVSAASTRTACSSEYKILLRIIAEDECDDIPDVADVLALAP